MLACRGIRRLYDIWYEIHSKIAVWLSGRSDLFSSSILTTPLAKAVCLTQNDCGRAPFWFSKRIYVGGMCCLHKKTIWIKGLRMQLPRRICVVAYVSLHTSLSVGISTFPANGSKNVSLIPQPIGGDHKPPFMVN